MRRTAERPDLRGALASGEISFDRIEALSRIPEDVGLLAHLDVAGVRREAANRAHITAEDEYRTVSDQFLVLQPSLDESWWKLWGGFDGATGALVDKVISERADDLPLLPDGSRGDSSWRKAMALAKLCVTDDPPPSPAHRIRRHQPGHHIQRTGQCRIGSRTPDRAGSPRSHALRCDHRNHRSRPRTAHPWSTDEDKGPSHPPSDGPSSTATAMHAPATAVPAPTASKSTTSSPGQKVEPPTPTI